MRFMHCRKRRREIYDLAYDIGQAHGVDLARDREDADDVEGAVFDAREAKVILDDSRVAMDALFAVLAQN